MPGAAGIFKQKIEILTLKTKKMKAINPYLNFPGNTEEAFNFYKSIFGGEFTNVQRFGKGEKIPESVSNKIMHIALPVGNGNVLMGTDACEEMGFKLTKGNNMYIILDPESKEEADNLFNSLAKGGKIGQPLQDTFWGAYYGDVTDKFGIQWMVNYTYPQK
jgi:PhnB protein